MDLGDGGPLVNARECQRLVFCARLEPDFQCLRIAPGRRPAAGTCLPTGQLFMFARHV